MSEEAPGHHGDSLATAEARVEAKSGELKKSLGLPDLVLTQILFIVGLAWIGVAGKLGPSHVVFWLFAIVFFYAPSAVVVMYLNKLMPLEGGLYQWAKLGFNKTVGFMLAWNLWLYVILNTSEIGLQTATYLSYALGARGKWMTESKLFISLSSVLIVGLLMVVAIRGLGFGKWIHNVGAVVMLSIFALIVALPILNYFTGHLDSYRPFATARPVANLNSLNILGKMGFGALGGFEYIAILAGETKSPGRTVGRSVLIAAPIIALMFILGTSSVIALIPTDQIDLIGPVAQVLSAGFKPFGMAAGIVSAVIVATLGIRLAQASVNFIGVTRLPMVAGWDELLPAWFTHLHARHKTPVNSILLVGLITIVMALLSLIGVGQQEAFQLVFNASGIFYAITYLVLFLIPLIGLRKVQPPPPLWLRGAALSGFLMTLLYVVLSIFPIIQVASRTGFALKISSVIVIANVVGVMIMVRAATRKRGAEVVNG